MNFDQEDIRVAVNEMKKAHKKIFSLAPHLTICSPETQGIKDFILQYPLDKKELALLSKYQKEVDARWKFFEKKGTSFYSELKKQWLPIFDRLLIQIQAEVSSNKTPRLSYHLDDLKGINL